MRYLLSFYNVAKKRIEDDLTVKFRSHLSSILWVNDYNPNFGPNQHRILIGLDKIKKIKLDNSNQVFGQQPSEKLKLTGEIALVTLTNHLFKDGFQKAEVHSVSDGSHSRHKVISMHFIKGRYTLN